MAERIRLVVLCFLVYVVVMCSSKSIQKQNSTVDEMQNDRIEDMENVIKTLENKIEILNDTKFKGMLILFYFERMIHTTEHLSMYNKNLIEKFPKKLQILIS